MFLFSLFLACTNSGVVGSNSDSNDLFSDEPEIVVEVETVEEEVCATLIDRQICNFQAINSSGETVDIHDYIGKPMIIDLSAMWCGPCQMAATEVQSVQDEYGLNYVTLLIENGNGEDPTSGDLQSWESYFDINTAPVLGGNRDIITSDILSIENQLYLTSWPTFYFLDDELRVKGYYKGFNQQVIEDWAATLTQE